MSDGVAVVDGPLDFSVDLLDKAVDLAGKLVRPAVEITWNPVAAPFRLVKYGVKKGVLKPRHFLLATGAAVVALSPAGPVLAGAAAAASSVVGGAAAGVFSVVSPVVLGSVGAAVVAGSAFVVHKVVIPKLDAKGIARTHDAPNPGLQPSKSRMAYRNTVVTDSKIHALITDPDVKAMRSARRAARKVSRTAKPLARRAERSARRSENGKKWLLRRSYAVRFNETLGAKSYDEVAPSVKRQLFKQDPTAVKKQAMVYYHARRSADLRIKAHRRRRVAGRLDGRASRAGHAATAKFPNALSKPIVRIALGLGYTKSRS